MYGKLFASMFSGSLYGHWQAIVTFQQMIILADKDGTIEMTHPAISAITSIPLEIIETGIAILEATDRHSRTPDEEGRRIIRISTERPWGWHITNYEHYRSIRTAEERRDYHKAYWHGRKKDTQPDSTSTQQNQPIVEVKVEAEAKVKRKAVVSVSFKPPTLEEVTSYCQERMNGISPRSFIDHYSANGWIRGKTKIKDWKACVRTWEARSTTQQTPNIFAGAK